MRRYALVLTHDPAEAENWCTKLAARAQEARIVLGGQHIATVNAMSGDRERYLALGMDDYLSKPVDQRELHAKLFAVLGKGRKLGTPISGSGSGDSQEELEGLFDQIDRALVS